MNEHVKRMDEICRKYPLSETLIVRPPVGMMVDENGVELATSRDTNKDIVHRFEVQRALAHNREQLVGEKFPTGAKPAKLEVPVIRDYVIDGSKIETMEDVQAIFSIMNVKFRNPDKETMDKLKHLFT